MRLFNHTELPDKEKRNLSILEMIMEKGPISRTEISRATNINIVSVSNYVASYIEKGLVVEKGLDVSSGGRKPELIELNSGGNYVIGIEAGKSRIRILLAEAELKIIDKKDLPNSYENIDAAARDCADSIGGILRKNKLDKKSIKAVGIGIPCGDFAPFADILEKKLEIDTFVGGYAFCAAFGEKRLNPVKEARNFLYMYSDLGRGIAVKDDIFIGVTGKSGEIGISEEENSAADTEIAKNSRYLMPWGNVFGVVESAKKEVSRGVGTNMVELAGGKIDNITEDLVIEAARQKDKVASDIIETVGINLGLRIAYLVNLFNPGAVIVGGCAEKAGELILGPVKKMIKRLALVSRSASLKIISGVLKDDAVALGAAALAAREIFLNA